MWKKGTSVSTKLALSALCFSRERSTNNRSPLRHGVMICPEGIFLHSPAFARAPWDETVWRSGLQIYYNKNAIFPWNRVLVIPEPSDFLYSPPFPCSLQREFAVSLYITHRWTVCTRSRDSVAAVGNVIQSTRVLSW